jgi:hypothetical protein
MRHALCLAFSMSAAVAVGRHGFTGPLSTLQGMKFVRFRQRLFAAAGALAGAPQCPQNIVPETNSRQLTQKSTEYGNM